MATLLRLTHPGSASSAGTRIGLGPAAECWSIQGAVPGQHDSVGGNSSKHRSWILLSLGNQRSMATSLGTTPVLLILATQACRLVITNLGAPLRWLVTRGASQTCSGSAQSSQTRRRVSESNVQTKHACREGGASLQVRAPEFNR